MDDSIAKARQRFFEEGFTLDVDSLYAHLERLPDPRKARGKRYPLALVLVLVVLAKLAGEDCLEGIAQWGRARAASLCSALHLARKTLPAGNTYRRVLGALRVTEVDKMVCQFLKRRPEGGQRMLVSLDGKQLRGTIGRGDTRGVHLLAAYVPSEGLVLMQVAVEGKENEISATPRLLSALDLRAKVVVGDALLTQRAISWQVVAQGGEYLWFVKDNQAELRAAIEALFQDPAGPGDGQRAERVNKGHGRLERRRLISSCLLKEYLAWPHLEQVFKLERWAQDSARQRGHHETV